MNNSSENLIQEKNDRILALESELANRTAELAALSEAAMNADLYCWGPCYSAEKSQECIKILRILSQPDANRTKTAWKFLDCLRSEVRKELAYSWKVIDKNLAQSQNHIINEVILPRLRTSLGKNTDLWNDLVQNLTERSAADRYTMIMNQACKNIIDHLSKMILV